MYIEPLLEELRLIWSTRTLIQDASKLYKESFHYLKAVLMFRIHDYPAYGIVVGRVTKGYKGCVCCRPNNICRRSKFLAKNVWDNQHCRWLPISHPLRDNEFQFRGASEHQLPPTRLTGTETKIYGEQREQWLCDDGVPGAPHDPVRVHGEKRKSPFLHSRTRRNCPPLPSSITQCLLT